MEQQLNDDSSHYEISLTAGQAFVAFVLLLLSLAASFAFGIMVGRGQGPTALAGGDSQSAPVITEKSATVDVPEEATPAPEPARQEPAPAEKPPEDFVIKPADALQQPKPASKPEPAPAAPAPAPSTEAGPHFAQLLSTADQKTAEALAAKLIDDGFTTAYVERTQGDGGMIHRVRVRFPSEAAARAAVPKLQRYTKEEIWVTRQQ